MSKDRAKALREARKELRAILRAGYDGREYEARMRAERLARAIAYAAR